MTDIENFFGDGSLRTIEAMIADLSSSPSTSQWLRLALIEAIRRDPLDALRDAEVLTELLELRFNAVVMQQTKG